MTTRNAMRQIHTVDMVAAILRTLNAFTNNSVGLFALFAVLSINPKRQAHRFVWFLSLMAIALMILFNEPFGVFVNLRYTLLLWVPLALIAGLGIDQLLRFGVPSALLLGLLLINGIWHISDAQLEEQYDLPIRYLAWDTLAETVAPLARAGDHLAFLVSIAGNDWQRGHEERVMPHYFHDSPLMRHFVTDVRNLPDADNTDHTIIIDQFTLP